MGLTPSMGLGLTFDRARVGNCVLRTPVNWDDPLSSFDAEQPPTPAIDRGVTFG